MMHTHKVNHVNCCPYVFEDSFAADDLIFSCLTCGTMFSVAMEVYLSIISHNRHYYQKEYDVLPGCYFLKNFHSENETSSCVTF